jgi:hypothetical protein
MNENKENTYSNMNTEIFDNLFIEIVSIIKRYFSNLHIKNEDMQFFYNEFADKIINETNILDQLIFLLNRENLTILKLLHFIFISVIRK